MVSNRPSLRAVEEVPDRDDGEGTGAYPDGTVAPCDLDAEATVLSHCFEHGPIVGLAPKHFYADANRRVYEAMQSCALRGEPTDPIFVVRELRATKRLEQCGGATYVANLIHQPYTVNAPQHAEAVKELYRRRVLAAAALELRVELCNGLAAKEAWTRFRAICADADED
jgi:replicative DNA helicase